MGKNNIVIEAPGGSNDPTDIITQAGIDLRTFIHVSANNEQWTIDVPGENRQRVVDWLKGAGLIIVDTKE